MRAALLSELPALTKFYGITPSDIEAMTLREISEYRSQLQRHIAEQEG